MRAQRGIAKIAAVPQLPTNRAASAARPCMCLCRLIIGYPRGYEAPGHVPVAGPAAAISVIGRL